VRTTVQARLSRLEAGAPQPGRIVTMFVWGKTEGEIQAEQADMVRRGLASPSDKFQVFTWLEPTCAGRKANARGLVHCCDTAIGRRERPNHRSNQWGTAGR
jgi:hypothetical protein